MICWICCPLWIWLFSQTMLLLLVLLHLQVSLQQQVRHLQPLLTSLNPKEPLRTSTCVLRVVLLDGAMSHSWRRPTASARPGLRARPAAALVAPAARARLTAGRHQKSRNVTFTTATTFTSPLYRDFFLHCYTTNHKVWNTWTPPNVCEELQLKMV